MTNRGSSFITLCTDIQLIGEDNGRYLRRDFYFILSRSSGRSRAHHFLSHSFDQKLVTLPHLTARETGICNLTVCLEIGRNGFDGNVAVSSVTHLPIQVKNLLILEFSSFLTIKVNK